MTAEQKPKCNSKEEWGEKVDLSNNLRRYFFIFFCQGLTPIDTLLGSFTKLEKIIKKFIAVLCFEKPLYQNYIGIYFGHLNFDIPIVALLQKNKSLLNPLTPGVH